MTSKTGLLILALVVALMSATGCGVMVHGTTQDIMINAPNDVWVKANEVRAPAKGSTIMKLQRKKEHSITAEREGSSVVLCGVVQKSVSASILLSDILWSPLLWLLPDFISGGIYNLEPAIVTCPMTDFPKTGPVVEKSPAQQYIGSKSEQKSVRQESIPQNTKANFEPQADSAAKLKKLKELYASGLITQAEYDAKRSKIMESL